MSWRKIHVNVLIEAVYLYAFLMGLVQSEMTGDGLKPSKGEEYEGSFYQRERQ